ncbi:hypothetical protein [Microbacterium sp. NIBRBAC000506063]
MAAEKARGREPVAGGGETAVTESPMARATLLRRAAASTAVRSEG